jgi:acyl-CoA thioesterase
MNIDHFLDLASLHHEKYTKNAQEQASEENQDNQDVLVFTIPKEWSQGRTVYGGISAGISYSAAKSYVDSDRVLRSMTTNFVGPLLSEVAFEVNIEIIRAGKNVVQVQSRIFQEDKICVVCQFCFGQARASKINVQNEEKHLLAAPAKANFIPQIPKIVPKFLRHFDLAIVDGSIPFSGKATSHYHGFMRYKKPPKQFSDAHIVSIIDAWPPTLLQMLKWPAPASTVCWNLEFLHPHRPIKPHDWLAYKASTRQAGDGYGHTEATIWDADGEVIALSRQTIAIFD